MLPNPDPSHVEATREASKGTNAGKAEQSSARQASGAAGDKPAALGPHNPFDVSWRERALVLGLVFGGLAALIAVGLQLRPEATKQLFQLIPASFALLGKFLPSCGIFGMPPAIPADEILWGPYQLGLVIGIMDTCTVLIIVYSLEALYRTPGIRTLLTKANNNAQLVLDAFPRMRSFAIVSIILFVLFPVAGTGAIGGSFLGGVLGIHRFRIIAAVAAGGFLGGAAMAWLFVHFGRAVDSLKGNPWLLGLVIAIAVAFFVMLGRAYKKALARAREERATGARESTRG